MTTNGHNSDEMPELEAQLAEEQVVAGDATRVGISNMLGLEQNSGLGYSFNALQIMARLSDLPEEWMGMTEYSDREIQIMSLRDARRNRARYGNSRLDMVDWRKAVRRISRNRRGREEIERMFIAERQRQGFAEEQQRSRFERMMGANRPQDGNPMKLNG